tara:strand:- start:9981 stop:10235 length:255 start_codon:yes stop_codon:yes gene_type:complete
MFILTEKNSGGVYAVSDTIDGQKMVQCFELEDDALRYHDLLIADDYPTKLEIVEVEPEIVAINCKNYGYKYTIISPNDFVIPPS